MKRIWSTSKHWDITVTHCRLWEDIWSKAVDSMVTGHGMNVYKSRLSTRGTKSTNRNPLQPSDLHYNMIWEALWLAHYCIGSFAGLYWAAVLCRSTKIKNDKPRPEIVHHIHSKLQKRFMLFFTQPIRNERLFWEALDRSSFTDHTDKVLHSFSYLVQIFLALSTTFFHV